MANIWRDPIFDRTLNDVTFALRQIEGWKNSHTHNADLKIENDALILRDDGVVYVTDDSFVLKNNGATYIENDALIVQFGIVHDLKGCLNLSDITRIEDNVTYLASRLTQYHYPLDVTTKEWSRDSLPTAKDMQRITDNIRSLLKDYATPRGADAVPELMLSHEDINALEHNLYLLKQIFDAMVGSFVKSGAYKSGATRLPIRR